MRVLLYPPTCSTASSFKDLSVEEIGGRVQHAMELTYNDRFLVIERSSTFVMAPGSQR
jgi:hypothetical protein